ncbi:hypothetical protein FKM82_000607 [Ascaphus truei]
MDTVHHVFRGTFVHSTGSCDMEILENHILGVGSTGKILFLEDARELAKLAIKWGFDERKMEELSKNEFFMPGMVDTHIHAPQYSFMGSAMDRPLLEWLEHTTFPTEEKYTDLQLAKDLYSKVVRRTLKNGTTTACYFATIHTDASLVLADLTYQYGQRAFIGKVCMDSNKTYPKYIESTDQSIEEAERFIEVLKHKNSHISESVAEIEEVLKTFPDYNSYTEVYSKNKLLTKKTVMAHGCYLTDEELSVFRTKGAAISHCPNSNISLCSGHLDVRNVIKQNVKLGLGTDVAGGYTVSMLDAVRKAIETSKILFIQHEKREKENRKKETNQNENDVENEIKSAARDKVEKEHDYKVLSYHEAFKLATLGGSQALNIDHITGNFEVNKEFDALLINPEAEDSPFEVFCNIPKEDMVQKFLYLGDDRNIKAVYVAGRCVVPFQNQA